MGDNLNRNLFQDADGKPMKFYIKPCPTKGKVRPLIESCGGQVIVHPTDGVIRLAEPDTLTPLGYVSASFIFDSVANNALQDIESYMCPDSRSGAVETCTKKSSTGRLFYTTAEDAAILEYIENYGSPALPAGGNEIWKKMEKKKITCHSWQSMKDHYKKKLMRKHYRRAVKSQKELQVEVMKHQSESKISISNGSNKRLKREPSITLWTDTSFEVASICSSRKPEQNSHPPVIDLVSENENDKECQEEEIILNEPEPTLYDRVVGHEYDSQVILPQVNSQNGMLAPAKGEDECPVVGGGEAYNSDLDYENIQINSDDGKNSAYLNNIDKDGRESVDDLLTLSSKHKQQQIIDFTIQDQVRLNNGDDNHDKFCKGTILDNEASAAVDEKNHRKQIVFIDEENLNQQNDDPDIPKISTGDQNVNLEFSNQINEEILSKYFYCDFGYELRDAKSSDRYSAHSVTDQVQEMRKHHECMWEKDMRKDTNAEIKALAASMQMAEAGVACVYRALSGKCDDTRYYLKHNKTKDDFIGWNHDLDDALLCGNTAKLMEAGISEKRILQRLHYLSISDVKELIQSILYNKNA
ncbi:Telomeric repeat-binding factor 2-interacting protein 1 [Trichoplax sp. H2]|nr:Telomeric repeat-binding factor 2-interacting protein 1 [Trichoplax sp. H2]|eukprot:RDD38120.1 Telomeric repeat-binding factor 2-interacting protein 1 [Trichoplax sp. H2]